MSIVIIIRKELLLRYLTYLVDIIYDEILSSILFCLKSRSITMWTFTAVKLSENLLWNHKASCLLPSRGTTIVYFSSSVKYFLWTIDYIHHLFKTFRLVFTNTLELRPPAPWPQHHDQQNTSPSVMFHHLFWACRPPEPFKVSGCMGEPAIRLIY